jgi:ABC-type glycerol-3-phosphate transport system substrate-binding protein
MRLASRRSLLRGSLGPVTAGTLARSHFANAAATTATLGTQGFIPTRGGWIPRPHRAAYVRQGPMSPTIPYYQAYDPTYAQLKSEHNWNVAGSDSVTGGMTPQQAADKAWKRLEVIFTKYPIQQA